MGTIGLALVAAAAGSARRNIRHVDGDATFDFHDDGDGDSAYFAGFQRAFGQ